VCEVQTKGLIINLPWFFGVIKSQGKIRVKPELEIQTVISWDITQEMNNTTGYNNGFYW